MILYSEDVHSIFIGTQTLKRTQFADDTTLILDGTKGSLQAALNILELFGNLSGLKMNADKTKLIWIGSKRHCKYKLDVTSDFKWGEQDYVLLGIEFSTKLDTMPVINFEKTINKARGILKLWKRRILTPLGRITILKTLILPLFISIPTPEITLKEITTMFFGYLWGEKPDKIKITTICADYTDGGLRMINIQNFEKAVKLNRIKQILFNKEPIWYQFLLNTVGDLNNLVTLGSVWWSVNKIKLNPFWKAVFTYWMEACKLQKINSNVDILTSSIWYNSFMSRNNMYLQTWSKKGINVVGDVVDPEGKFLSMDDIKRKFDININFLHYYMVKKIVSEFINHHKTDEKFEMCRPYIPFHVKFIANSQTSAKSIYLAISDKEVSHTNEIKWNESLTEIIDKENWKNLYKACFFGNK